MKITIVGAGRGGCTLAADLTLMGHDVTLYQHPNFAASTLDPIRENGGIEINGVTMSGKNGKALPKLSCDAKEAVHGAEVVVFSLASFGHGDMMPEVIPHLEDGQVCMVTTGYWCSLRFRDLILRSDRKIYWVELELLPYLTDKPNATCVDVMAVKKSLGFSAFPACDNEYVTPIVKSLFPMVEPAWHNVLEVSAASLNPICHMPLILMNLATIDNTPADKTFNMYGPGTSPMTGKMMEALDAEKLAFGRLFGIEMQTAMERRQATYPIANPEGKGMYHYIIEDTNNEGFVLYPREYFGILDEDLPNAIAPMLSIANQYGLELPLHQSVVNIFKAAYDEHVMDKGLTVESMGLTNLSKEELLSLVNEGK